MGSSGSGSAPACGRSDGGSGRRRQEPPQGPEAPIQRRSWTNAQAASAPQLAAAPPQWQVGQPCGGRAQTSSSTSVVRMTDLQFGEILGTGGFGSVYRGRL